MSDNQQLVVSRENPTPVYIPPSPLAMVDTALKQGASLETITKLMDLADRYEANEARKAYNAAFAAFKSEAVTIVKNITVSDGPLKGKKYADLFAVVNAITPALSKHGLSHSWTLTKDEENWIEVTCILRHQMGHAETVSMGGKPDVGGAKNAIQARASSKSYLERYTLLAITGMAASGDDADGNYSPECDITEELEWIANACSVDELKRLYTAAYKKAQNAKDHRAMQQVIAAKNERLKELQ